jgi:hypothetical protein
MKVLRRGCRLPVMRVEVGVFEVQVAVVVPGERPGVIYVGLADLVSI